MGIKLGIKPKSKPRALGELTPPRPRRSASYHPPCNCYRTMPRQLRRAASPVPFVDVKSLWRNGVFCPIILFVCCAPHHVVAQLTPTLIGDNTSPTDHTDICFVACEETPDTDIAVPGTGCQQFYVCRGGKITNRLACSDGRAFNNEIGFCDHESVVECVDPTCSPTDNPTTSPTASPSDSPTTSPTGRSLHCYVSLWTY